MYVRSDKNRAMPIATVSLSDIIGKYDISILQRNTAVEILGCINVTIADNADAVADAVNELIDIGFRDKVSSEETIFKHRLEKDNMVVNVVAKINIPYWM